MLLNAPVLHPGSSVSPTLDSESRAMLPISRVTQSYPLPSTTSGSVLTVERAPDIRIRGPLTRQSLPPNFVRYPIIHDVIT